MSHEYSPRGEGPCEVARAGVVDLRRVGHVDGSSAPRRGHRCVSGWEGGVGRAGLVRGVSPGRGRADSGRDSRAHRRFVRLGLVPGQREARVARGDAACLGRGSGAFPPDARGVRRAAGFGRTTRISGRAVVPGAGSRCADAHRPDRDAAAPGGCPVRGENYFKAEIVAGRVGAYQAAPRKEFD